MRSNEEPAGGSHGNLLQVDQDIYTQIDNYCKERDQLLQNLIKDLLKVQKKGDRAQKSPHQYIKQQQQLDMK